jgi:hypothetical protein
LNIEVCNMNRTRLYASHPTRIAELVNKIGRYIFK